MLVILHGSRATGNIHQNSDWDIAVLTGHAISRDERGALRRSLATKLGAPEERIDIADLYNASPLLRYRAAMFGRMIDGDSLDFRRLQISAWKDYLNNQKVYDLQSRFLAKALS